MSLKLKIKITLILALGVVLFATVGWSYARPPAPHDPLTITLHQQPTQFILTLLILAPTVTILALFIARQHADKIAILALPAGLTAGVGMDAFAHNLEAYLSTAYHPICDAVALGGIRLASENLETAVKEGGSIEARSNMMLSSSMGAIAFQKDLGAAHSMAHPLSTIAGVPHGLANAIILTHVMAYNKPAATERLGNVAQAMGCPVDGQSDEERADAAIEAVRSLTERINIPRNLSAVGVTESQIPALVSQAIEDPNHITNPRLCTPIDFTILYRQAL